jgi:hypothetical protein
MKKLLLVLLLGGSFMAPSQVIASPSGVHHHSSKKHTHHNRKHHHVRRDQSHHNRPAGAYSSDSGAGISAMDIAPKLAAKTQEIVQDCGSKVISSFRPGARVLGSGRLSLHGFHKAVDIQGNYPCIYAHLQNWPGGYSIDPDAVHHVHVSLGGREDGRRFVHHGHAKARYAALFRLRYASSAAYAKASRHQRRPTYMTWGFAV